MKLLGLIGWFVVTCVVSALVTAAALRQVWSWFCAAQYGPGPSLGAWYGVSLIVGLTITRLASDKSDKHDKSDVITATITGWLGIGLVLLIAWCVGSVFGWVQ